jgi:hypothetical protein
LIFLGARNIEDKNMESRNTYIVEGHVVRIMARLRAAFMEFIISRDSDR